MTLIGRTSIHARSPFAVVDPALLDWSHWSFAVELAVTPVTRDFATGVA